MFKQKKRVFTAVLLCFFVSFMLSACGETSAKHKVAVITKSTDSEFFKAVRAGANAASAEYNLEMTFEGPASEEDYEAQNALIRSAVKDGAEAIVLSAIDYNRNAETVDEAAQTGVKIVVIDSDVNSKSVSCKIGTNDYKAGISAADAALALNSGNLYVGIVNFDQNTKNGQEREKGFRERIGEISRVKSVITVNVASDIEGAQAGAMQMLTEHPEINVLVTFNEWTSLGCGWAIRALDAKDRVDVIVFDNNPVSVGRLESGEVDALVVQRPYAMGYLGVEAAYHLLCGKQPEDTLYTETSTVTRENMYTPEMQEILF